MSNFVQSPHTEVILENLQFQGASNDCGPYSAATVICALSNEFVDGGALARQMNKPRRRGVLPIIRRVPNWATFPWGVADVLREYGFAARWRVRTPPEYLRPALANGHVLIPIIGEWRPKTWAHFMPLVAWDETRGWGFANPQNPEKTISWVPDDLFRRRWRNYGRLLVEVEGA